MVETRSGRSKNQPIGHGQNQAGTPGPKSGTGAAKMMGSDWKSFDGTQDRSQTPKKSANLKATPNLFQAMALVVGIFRNLRYSEY